MNRFANLVDRPRSNRDHEDVPPDISTRATSDIPPSRAGRKVISGYFSPEMSLSMHMCARRAGISLQALMAEAFNDVLRKHGESPVGK